MSIGIEFIKMLATSLLTAKGYGNTSGQTGSKFDSSNTGLQRLWTPEDERDFNETIDKAIKDFWGTEKLQTIHDEVEKMQKAMMKLHAETPLQSGKVDDRGEPYWNESDWEDNFTDLLYKAGVPVQVRELNETQSIIKERIRNIADGIFLESGEILKAGQVTYSNNVSYVSLSTQVLMNDYTTTYDGLDSSLYIIGKYITDSTGLIKAKVIAATADSNQEVTAENYSLTLFLTYIYSDGGESTVDNIFKSGDGLYILKNDGTVDSTKQVGTVGKFRNLPLNATGKSSIAQIKEGVIYVNGVTLKVWPQTLIVSKYSTFSTFRIGLAIEERLITAAESSKLADPAQGTPNEGGPGADRKQLMVRLAKRTIDSESNERFLDLLKVVNGDVQWKNSYIQEDASKSDIVEYEYTHRGDKIITQFDYEVREHLSTNTDSNGESGLYTASTGGSDTLLSLGVGNGTGTVQGREVDILSKQRVNIEKPRALKTKTSTTSVAAQVGNYVVTDGGIDITSTVVTSTGEYVTWLNFAPTVITEAMYTSVNLRKAATVIGTAKVRDITRFNSEFQIYLFDINITTAGNTLKDVEELTTANEDYKIADINTEFTQAVVQSYGTTETGPFESDRPFNIDHTLTSLNDTSKNKNLFKIPKDGVSDDTGVSSVTINSVRTTFVVTAASGKLTVNLSATGETFDTSSLSGTTNEDIIVYGISGSNGKMWSSTELEINYASTTSMEIEDSGSAITNAANYVVIAPIKLSSPVTIAKTVKFYTYNVTAKATGTTMPIALLHPDVLDKNWKIYQKGDGWSSSADTLDTDISSRFELDSGQRDNTYELGSFKLKDGEEAPTGSLRIDYYYLDTTHASNIRTGDYISVDSYPVGSVPASPADGWGTFLYTDIPKYTSPSTGISYRLSDVIDFRPTKSTALSDTTSTSSGSGNRNIASTSHGLIVGDSVKIPSGADDAFEIFSVATVTDTDNFVVDSDLSNVVTSVQIFRNEFDAIVSAPRTPFNTTVDIGQLKYYQPRIDKVYLTNGSKDTEEITDGNLIIGEKYKIVSIGNSNFTLVGASVNVPDEIFIASGTSSTSSGTGTVTRFVGNLRVIKGTPYDGEAVVPDDPKVGLPVFEIRVPSYVFETKDVVVKQVDNVERKNFDVSKFEKIIENLQRHASVDPLEAKVDSHDLGRGRKKVGHFFDSFEGQEKSDVLLKEYSASIDRFRNELRPEYSSENMGIRVTPYASNSLYDPQTNSVSDKELITLPLNSAKNFEIEVQNVESSTDIPLRTSHTDVYNGYMRVTPNYDYWKSTQSRPDLIRNKNGEFDAIKHHPTSADVNGMVWEDWRTHWAGFSKNEFEELSSDTSYKNVLNELKKSYEVESNSIEVAGKHVLTDYVPYIRTQNIVIEAYGLRPNSGNIRLKFDGVNITTDVYNNTSTSSSFKNTTTSALKTDD